MMFDDERMADRNGVSATVSVRDWFLFDLLSLLNLIPIVGPLALIGIYIALACVRGTAPSVASRVIMSLIWIAVEVVIVAVVLLVATVAGIGLPTVDVSFN